VTKALPWMPLHIDDYEEATEHLTLEQDGAYMRLLRKCWRNGWLPDDDFKLASICGCTKVYWLRHIAPAIRPFFFEVEPGKITQKRLKKERENAGKISEKRSGIAKEMHKKKSETKQALSNDSNDIGSAIAGDLHEQEQVQASGHKQGHIQIEDKALHCLPSDSVPETANGEAPAPAGKSSTAKMPRLSDPIGTWDMLMRGGPAGFQRKHGPDTKVSDIWISKEGSGHAVQSLIPACQSICRAARMWDPNVRLDWWTVVNWVCVEGFCVNYQIIPAIEDVVKRRGESYVQPNSLRYFEQAIRFYGQRKAA
jgi:uncharacterized protein YdaU (DUF1376 family)